MRVNIIAKKSQHLLRYNLYISRDVGNFTTFAFGSAFAYGPAENPEFPSYSMFYDSRKLFSYTDNFPLKKKTNSLVYISFQDNVLFKGYDF